MVIATTRYRRRRAFALSTVLLIVSALIVPYANRSNSFAGVTESTERAGYFFRLKAKYSHNGEPIDFDIVVACSIRIDRHRGGDSGFLAARYPRFIVQRTHNDNAVMQIVPIACRGETTENGMVPVDFLPGAVWFDKLGDYRFGIGYVSEDAFDNPSSQLKFHGAMIEKATHADWEAFEKLAADNEGMRSRYYDRPYYWTGDANRIAKSSGSEIEAAYARACRGVIRYKLSEAARKVVRKYWPDSKPQFWATSNRDDGPWPDLLNLEKTTPIFANGFRLIQHLYAANYEYGGFATRNWGGMIHSNVRKRLPAEFFPVRFDEGVPWVFLEKVSNSPYLAKHVEIRTGPGKGFLYCYTILAGELAVAVPDARSRRTGTQVDGTWVITPKLKNRKWPNPFFEADEYMYREFEIGLS
jgi:hypothetical protein